MSEYSWGNFWGLIREAQSTGEAVDLHDLRNGVKSFKEWALLHQEQADAAKQLIDYVTANSGPLLYAARESLADPLNRWPMRAATLSSSCGEW